MSPAAIVGARVRELRRASGLTLDAIAGRACMARPNWLRVERGEGNPTLATLVRVAEALGVTVADLVRDVGRQP